MGEFTIMGHEDTYIHPCPKRQGLRSYYIEYIDNRDISKLVSHSKTGVLIEVCFMAPDKCG